MSANAQRSAAAQLDGWIARQRRRSAHKMMSAVSAVDLVKERRGFARFIRPAKGSILASPAMAAYDPDPDYFFHWLRDSAVVVDALRLLVESGGIAREAGLSHFADFLTFSLSIASRDGRAFLRESGPYHDKVEPPFVRFLRPEEEFLALSQEDALGEPRFDPDGSLDILKWSRPQHDGPALRALCVLRCCASFGLAIEGEARDLLLRDLAFTRARWRTPSFDIWEEETGRHYYTQLAQAEALARGADWRAAADDEDAAAALRAAASEIEAGLDDFWCQERDYMLSRVGSADGAKDLDIAVALAAIHAGRANGAHSVCDPRLIATLARLEALFSGAYAINRRAPGAQAPAMGRYAGDRYYSGGAYFFSTLGAAEFYFRAAEAAARGTCPVAAWRGAGIFSDDDARHPFAALLRRGELFLETVAAHVGEDGDLSEQFDQTTGAQTSAKTLAWSHAAFISASASRERALRAGGRP